MLQSLAPGLALFFAGLFAVAAWHKLRYRDYYGALVAEYLGSDSGRPATASLIGLAELALALALLTPWRDVALAAASLVLLLYAGAMHRRLGQAGQRARCGCSGPGSDARISPALIRRNLALAAVALGLSFVAVDWPRDPVAAFVALASAAFCGLLYATAEQLIVNAQQLREGLTA